MKTCPVCALDLEDSFLFCPDDGSNLSSVPGGSSKIESTAAGVPDDENVGAVVLYCPACAAEYPLTFSSCPVHGLQLTKHRIPRLASKSILRPPEFHPTVRSSVDQAGPKKQLTTLDLTRHHTESPSLVATNELDEVDSVGTDVEGHPVDSSDTNEFVFGTTAFDHHESSGDSSERRLERPGFRVAAIATVIALAVFALVAIYTIASNFSRRSSASAGKTVSTAQTAQPQPVVLTPKEAQDYKEETPVAEPSDPEAQPQQPQVERVRRDSGSTTSTERLTRKNPEYRQSEAAPSPEAPVTKVSNQPMQALPRGNTGGFDSRLIRVRSRKTPAGVRYDLTFNMQEQAGRLAHWQRVLISTRSASGASHSQAIPFSHRLGAAGALTFTVSVELTGRSEADWQGRVVCTALGWDNKGAPLQASFGANVTP